jgi:hypothetical protein
MQLVTEDSIMTECVLETDHITQLQRMLALELRRKNANITIEKLQCLDSHLPTLKTAKQSKTSTAC